MPLTTRDVLHDADLFRQAHPSWPLADADDRFTRGTGPEPHSYALGHDLDLTSDASRCRSCGHVAAADCGCVCCPQCEHPDIDTYRQTCRDCGEPVSDEIADDFSQRWYESHYGVSR